MSTLIVVEDVGDRLANGFHMYRLLGGALIGDAIGMSVPSKPVVHKLQTMTDTQLIKYDAGDERREDAYEDGYQDGDRDDGGGGGDDFGGGDDGGGGD